MDKRRYKLTKNIMNIKYTDVYIVEDDDEAQEFRYEHNNKTVEVGTPVAYDVFKRGAVFNGHPHRPSPDTCILTCFEGIYHQADHN